jgi:uncharacterized cupredoxin-like copper-binding protein
VSGRQVWIVLAALLGLVGIGLVVYDQLQDDDDDATGGGATTTQPVSIQLEPGTLGAFNREFFPNPITVRAGSTLTFRNTDEFPHTFTADDDSFDSGDVAPGETFETTVPTTTGTVPFHCEIHGGMIGTINVIPAG